MKSFHDALVFLDYHGSMMTRQRQQGRVNRKIIAMALLGITLLTPAAADQVQEQAVLSPAKDIVYSGQEKLHFSISWSGGIKIGDLWLSLEESGTESLLIEVVVRDYGLFRFFYPVDDRFVTTLDKKTLLPLRYEVDQVEGHGKHHTRRLTIYDQHHFVALYQKNDGPRQRQSMGGPAHNEFSSFYWTRILQFSGKSEPIVPTFVDGKRHLVRVALEGKSTMNNTIFGDVSVLGVQPKMHFKGLYDKDGATTFWLTDDDCRVPMRIRSKILIGSLVADLVEYSNPACTQWRDWRKQLQERKKNRPPIGVGD